MRQPVEQIVSRFKEITGATEMLMPSEGAPGIAMLHGTRGVRVIYNTVGTAESLEVSVRIAGRARRWFSPASTRRSASSGRRTTSRK